MAIEYQKTGRGSYYPITSLILSSYLKHRTSFSLHLAMIHISKVFGVSKLIYIHLAHSRTCCTLSASYLKWIIDIL